MLNPGTNITYGNRYQKIFVKSITSLPELLIFSRELLLLPESSPSQSAMTPLSTHPVAQAKNQDLLMPLPLIQSNHSLIPDSLHLYYTSLVHHCVLPRLLHVSFLFLFSIPTLQFSFHPEARMIF